MPSRFFTASLALLTAVSMALCAPAGDTVFKAMQDEMDRSMDRLVIEDMQPPYFMSYTVQDNDMVALKARYGALVATDRINNRYLSIEMRVGEPSLDNSNYIGSWHDLSNMRKDLVEEDDYNSLRHQLWLYTDKAYKRAAENLARKTAYLQTHPSMAEVPDFADAESFEYLEEPIDLKVDLGSWEAGVVNAAKVLDAFTALEDWRVEYQAYGVNRRYLNSEGGRHLVGTRFHLLEISATAQAEDGQRLTSFLSYVSRGDQNPLLDDDLDDDIRRMAGDLEAVAGASPASSFGCRRFGP